MIDTLSTSARTDKDLSKISEIQSKIDQHGGQIERLRAIIGSVSQEIFNATERERIRFSKMLINFANEQNCKILQMESNLRQEIQNNTESYAETLKVQQDDIHNFENMLITQIEKKFNTLKSYTTKALGDFKDLNQSEYRKQQASISSLLESINLLEKEAEASDQEITEIVKAEITERKANNRNIEDQIQSLEKNLAHAINTINLAISELDTKTNAYKLTKEINGENFVKTDTKSINCKQQLHELQETVDQIRTPILRKVTGLIKTENDGQTVESLKSVNGLKVDIERPIPMQDHSSFSGRVRPSKNDGTANNLDIEKRKHTSIVNRNKAHSRKGQSNVQSTYMQFQETAHDKQQLKEIKPGDQQRASTASSHYEPLSNKIIGEDKSKQEQINRKQSSTHNETEQIANYEPGSVPEIPKRKSNFKDKSKFYIKDSESKKRDIQTQKLSLSSQDQGSGQIVQENPVNIQSHQLPELQQFTSPNEALLDNPSGTPRNFDNDTHSENIVNPVFQNDDNISESISELAESDKITNIAQNGGNDVVINKSQKHSELDQLSEHQDSSNNYHENTAESSPKKATDNSNLNKLHQSSRDMEAIRNPQNYPSISENNSNLQQNPNIIAIMENLPLKKSSVKKGVGKNRFDTTDEDDSD
ncbi:uncharacterized protein TRIADDRAFT_53026 [Trichoplax adhaerens]|uniref:Uncharacterized protein n=1 Tax=Trichoplax adhaerens TaxID=10228 RepID=B3RN37_TRIAD|nr:hypothetical protein TRIADDRAFT_53026 [Trichoplax adhaerens]EDV27954.1 hypothetical protein TRIADDRAFT_53026 [Trichoplax adhaerens]|eukprot:XP_002109788.1 hypothetical protein TRIADDRAFT_53026 [Trichoplax adhaerens]